MCARSPNAFDTDWCAAGTWSSVTQITDSTPSGGTINLAGAGDGAFCLGVQGSLAAASAVVRSLLGALLPIC